MIRRLVLLCCVTLVVFGISTLSVRADGPNAWAANTVNLRSGPGTKYSTVGTVPPSTALILEGRNADTSWVLVHTADNSARGWAKTTLLQISASISLRSLPISQENLQPPAPAVPTSVVPDTSNPNALPSINVNGNLNAAVVPAISGTVRSTIRSLWARGKSMGNNARVFAKVGDCLTANWEFLNVFGGGDYNLGSYGYLQNVIQYYSVSPRAGFDNSFHEQSIAANNGFNAAAVLDPMWADPAVCKPNDSPLRCEYALTKPAVAIIMFGTADVLTMTPQQFNVYLRFMVKDSMDRGIIPILSTFPSNTNVPDQSRQINQVVLTVAKEKYLPVMNLDAALEKLPNHGMDGDGIHLSSPPNGQSGYFTPENLQFGYTMRNLVTLQTLYAVWQQLPH